jgi:hypothetical protein
MKAIENKAMIFETLEPKLVAEDDHALWQVALAVLTDEFEQRQVEASQQVFGRWWWVHAPTGSGLTIADGTRKVALLIRMVTKICSGF